jgi:N-acyl-L-homoserine lactone synthetase
MDKTQERADIDQEGELPLGYNVTLVSESTRIVLANVEAARRQGAFTTCWHALLAADVEAARRQGAHMLLLLADTYFYYLLTRFTSCWCWGGETSRCSHAFTTCWHAWLAADMHYY